jgi:hypothetical protein
MSWMKDGNFRQLARAGEDRRELPMIGGNRQSIG